MKRVYQVVRSLTLCLCLVCLTSCADPLTDAINKTWKPLSTRDQRWSAITLAKAQLSGFQTPNITLTVSVKEVQQALTEAINKQVSQLSDTKVEVQNQFLTLSANFVQDFKEQGVHLEGRALGVVGVAIAGNELILLPAFQTVEIKKATYGKVDVQLVVPLINTGLKKFLDNINGQLDAMKGRRIAFKIDPIKEIDLAAALRNTPGVTEAAGTPVKPNLFLKKAALHVNASGVHLLGELTLIGPPETLPSPNLPASPNNLSEEEVEKSFTELETSFMNARKQIIGVPPSNALAWAAVRKDTLAAALNASFAAPDLCATYQARSGRQDFDQTITPFEYPNFDCSPTRECSQNMDCSPSRDCSLKEDTTDCGQTRDCSATRGCPSNCEWHDLDCHARKLTCEALKAQEKGQCELEKEAARQACEIAKGTQNALYATEKANCERIKAQEKLGCEVQKTAAKLDCEQLKALEKLGCEANKEWLKLVANTGPIGSVVGNVDISGSMRACFKELTMSNDLDALSLAVAIQQGSADIHGDIKFTPMNLGTIACVAQWQEPFQTNARIPPQDLSLQGNISATADGDLLKLTLRTAAQKLGALLDPPPFQAIFNAHPHLYVLCLPTAIAVGFHSGVKALRHEDLDSIVTGKIEGDIPALSLPIEVQPIELTIEDRVLTGNVEWTDKALLFIVSKSR